MIIPLPLTAVLITFFVVNELLINPLFEVFKNKLVVARLRKLLSTGSTVQLTPEGFLWKTFGLSTGVQATDLLLYFLKNVKLSVKFFFLLSAAWWESGLSEIVVAKSQTFSLKVDALSRADGSISFASVTPHVPLTEDMIRGFPSVSSPSFSQVKKNNGSYTKGRNINLELRYFSDCVEDYPTKRIVYGALVRTVMPTQEFSETDEVISTEVVCLNGNHDRDSSVIMVFSPNSNFTARTTIESMQFLRNITTDGTNTLFAVKFQSKAELRGTSEFTGYVTLTARSHFDNNVAWSLYGYAVAPTKKLLRIIVALSDDFNGRPCSSEECLGNWLFGDTEITLPSGSTIDNLYDPSDNRGNQLEDIGLTVKSGILGSCIEDPDFEMHLALSWLAETNYATFNAAERFTDDIMNKLTGNIFFFSDMGVQSRSFKAFESKAVTQVLNGRTLPLMVSLTTLLVFAGIGGAVELRSRKTSGIRSEILTRDAVIGMYKSHISDMACSDNNKEDIEIGITITDEKEQRLGVVDKLKSQAASMIRT